MSSFVDSHDELKALFESDPAAFEAKRKEMIDAHISSQPEDAQESLRELQSKIDSSL